MAGDERAEDHLDAGLNPEVEQDYEPPGVDVIGSIEEFTRGAGETGPDAVDQISTQ